MSKLKKAVRWEVKEVGKERSIQLFDENGNKLKGEESYWEGIFNCSRNQLTTLQGAPKEVGGWFDCSSNQLTISECRPLKLTFESALKRNYVLADGILTKLISRKTKGNKEIFLTRKIGSKEKVWVVKDGDKFSHGAMLKQALEDLIFKASKRDVSEFKSWSLSKKVTLEEAITAYRSITGACSEGVKNFVKQSEIPKELTIESIIKLTEGKYGNTQFKEFFNESNN